MQTIVISTDKPKVDMQLVDNLRRLFPECKIQILHKKSDEPGKHPVVYESSTEKILRSRIK